MIGTPSCKWKVFFVQKFSHIEEKNPFVSHAQQVLLDFPTSAMHQCKAVVILHDVSLSKYALATYAFRPSTRTVRLFLKVTQALSFICLDFKALVVCRMSCCIVCFLISPYALVSGHPSDKQFGTIVSYELHEVLYLFNESAAFYCVAYFLDSVCQIHCRKAVGENVRAVWYLSMC